MSTTPEFPEITRSRLIPSMSAFAPPQDTAELLSCPRCNSTQTKFCYYNNYNLSQPRHFCRGCRRYWTRGGTLRDVPVGGGSRKKPKLSHHRASSSKSNSSGSPSSSSLTHDFAPNKSTSDSAVEKPDLPSDQQQVLKLTDNVGSEGGFSSMMTMTTQEQPGFLSLGGFGYMYGSGYAHGFTQGYGYGATAVGVDLPMKMTGGFSGVYSVPVTAASSGLDVNTWQMPVADHGGQGGGLVDWPETQILDSMPAVSGGGGGNEQKVATTSSANPCVGFPEY